MKTDLKKLFKHEYKASSAPELVWTEGADYLSISGTGDPSHPDFEARISALYGTAYTIKFECKKAEKDFVVSKLEAQWWFDEQKFPRLNISNAPQIVPRSEWNYRLLIRMPDFVDENFISDARRKVLLKKENLLAAEICSFCIAEGHAVQLLHVGPFDPEPRSLAILGKFIIENKLVKNGVHHEIYLSDFRKSAPEKFKTILREPVRYA